MRLSMTLPKKILCAVVAFFGIGFVLQGSAVLADEYGLDKTAETAGLKIERDLPTMIGDILGTALSFISVLFFILMLYGGFLWMTARGNSDQEGKARDTIFGAVIGLIIVLAAYAITQFVFSNLGPGPGAGGGDPKPGTKIVSCQQLASATGKSMSCTNTNTNISNCEKSSATAINEIYNSYKANLPGTSVVKAIVDAQSGASISAITMLCPNDKEEILCCIN